MNHKAFFPRLVVVLIILFSVSAGLNLWYSHLANEPLADEFDALDTNCTEYFHEHVLNDVWVSKEDTFYVEKCDPSNPGSEWSLAMAKQKTAQDASVTALKFFVFGLVVFMFLLQWLLTGVEPKEQEAPLVHKIKKVLLFSIRLVTVFLIFFFIYLWIISHPDSYISQSIGCAIMPC